MLLVTLVAALLALGILIFLTVHSWTPASCTRAETCSICGKTNGEPLPHSYAGGSCLEPGICTVCGAVQPEAAGHSWQRANCLTAGICSVCGANEPQAPGHDWADAGCETPRTCLRCGEYTGEPLGHIWDGNTKKTQCQRCGKNLTAEEQAQLLLESDSAAVFESLFAQPDWKALYQRAGVQDTEFEGVQQYVQRMSRLTGGAEYTAVSGSPEYEVSIGQEKVARFTLKRRSEKDPHWELDGLTLDITRPVTLTVQTDSDARVSVNGVLLDGRYLAEDSEPPIAEYLPEGTDGIRRCIWRVSGLLVEPELQVSDSTGPVAMTRDAVSGAYVADSAASDTVTDSERQLVFNALESYAGFMINASGGRAGVLKYFENGTQTCIDILQMGGELWMNKDRGHTFSNEKILFCRRYGDDLFAVRASLVMSATLLGGSTRDYTVAQTMFFRIRNGSWACYAMTNRDLLSPSVSSVGASADEWADCPDGIRIEEYQGKNFTAHVMLIRDPTRVYLGLSNYSRFAESVPGKRLTAAIVDEGAVAAVNAGAFNDNGTSDSTVGSIPAGLIIYQGRVVSNQYKGLVPEKGFCGLTADGRLIVADSMTEADAAAQGIYYGCEFGPVLIRDGVVNQTAQAKGGYNPRTVVAQREDGTILLVCADGRQAGSLGATYADMIELLQEYGAVNACNMDGGSSTVMLTQDASGVHFINSYSVLQSEPRRMPTFWMVKP